MSKDGDLRVWWIPQVPMDPFYYSVPDVKSGRMLTDALARYDLFQLEHGVKPDYSNTGGLEVFRDGEWEDWEDEDGNTIEDLERLESYQEEEN